MKNVYTRILMFTLFTASGPAMAAEQNTLIARRVAVNQNRAVAVNQNRQAAGRLMMFQRNALQPLHAARNLTRNYYAPLLQEDEQKNAEPAFAQMVKPAEQECVICYEAKLLFQLGCAHSFCTDCLKSEINHGRAQCSLCTKPMQADEAVNIAWPTFPLTEDEEGAYNSYQFTHALRQAIQKKIDEERARPVDQRVRSSLNKLIRAKFPLGPSDKTIILTGLLMNGLWELYKYQTDPEYGKSYQVLVLRFFQQYSLIINMGRAIQEINAKFFY